MPESVVLDENGWPILLADVPNAGISKVDPNAASGNPRHDARSGKFGSGGGGEKKPIQAPANTDPLEFARMLDAVRDAAREFDFLAEGDVKEFLAGRARNPEQVDIQAFMNLVREQIKVDIVDILDNQLRSSGALKRGRRTVRVTAPKGYVRRTLKGLDEAEISEIMHRLESRGHDPEDIDRFFGKHLPGEKTAAARAQPIAASDQWDAEVIPMGDGEWEDGYEYDPEAAMSFTAKIVDEVMRNLPQPVVNLQIPAQGPTKVTPVRNEKGLIEYTVTEPLQEED